jgi:hypothetical protein
MPPLLASMWKSDTGNIHTNDYLSASMLAGGNCMRQTYYERYEPFYEVPQKRFWPFRGTMIHTFIEGAGDLIERYGWMQEMRMETSLTYAMAAPVFEEDGTWTGDFDSTKDLEIKLKGTTDAYNPFTRTLVDLKSLADAKVQMMIKGSSPGTYSKHLQDSWIAQTNIYRFLAARTRITPEMRALWAKYDLPEIKGRTLPAPTNLVIQGVAMMSTPRSGAAFAHKERGTTTLYDIDRVPVWNIQEIEDFIRPRALTWYKALTMRQVPGVVGKDKAWLCGVCAFNGEKVEGQICHPTAERAAKEVLEAAP